MKTVKAIPHLLVASALLFSAACSSTNTGTGTASGAATATETGTGSSTGAAGGSTSGSAGATGTDNTATGGSVGPGSDMGSVGSMTGTTAAGGTAGTDMAAFMASFATMPDATFLLTAASSNLLEIQAGQMAAQKASSASVKKYAQMMLDHHSKATQQLQTVATPLGVTPAQTLMPVHQAMLDKLTSKSAGKDFDEAYMDAMETAHTMDIAMFQVKSKAAETPTVKAFASKTLPMLQSHRKMAGDLEKKVD